MEKLEMSEKEARQLGGHQVEDLEMPPREGDLTELIITYTQTRRLLDVTGRGQSLYVQSNGIGTARIPDSLPELGKSSSPPGSDHTFTFTGDFMWSSKAALLLWDTPSIQGQPEYYLQQCQLLSHQHGKTLPFFLVTSHFTAFPLPFQVSLPMLFS